MGNLVGMELLGEDLVSPSYFDELTLRLSASRFISPVVAGEIMDQNLAFLATCAQRRRGHGLAVSDLILPGWQVFMEDDGYKDFFHCRGWPVVTCLPQHSADRPLHMRVPETTAFMAHAGYRVRDPFWHTQVSEQRGVLGIWG